MIRKNKNFLLSHIQSKETRADVEFEFDAAKYNYFQILSKDLDSNIQFPFSVYLKNKSGFDVLFFKGKIYEDFKNRKISQQYPSVWLNYADSELFIQYLKNNKKYFDPTQMPLNTEDLQTDLIHDQVMVPTDEIFLPFNIKVAQYDDYQYEGSHDEIIRPLFAEGLKNLEFNFTDLEHQMVQIKNNLKKNPKDSELLAALSRCYFVFGWGKKAHEALNEAIKGCQASLKPHYYLLLSYYEQELRLDKLRSMDAKKREEEMRKNVSDKMNRELDKIFKKSA